MYNVWRPFLAKQLSYLHKLFFLRWCPSWGPWRLLRRCSWRLRWMRLRSRRLRSGPFWHACADRSVRGRLRLRWCCTSTRRGPFEGSDFLQSLFEICFRLNGSLFRSLSALLCLTMKRRKQRESEISNPQFKMNNFLAQILQELFG